MCTRHKHRRWCRQKKGNDSFPTSDSHQTNLYISILIPSIYWMPSMESFKLSFCRAAISTIRQVAKLFWISFFERRGKSSSPSSSSSLGESERHNRSGELMSLRRQRVVFVEFSMKTSGATLSNETWWQFLILEKYLFIRFFFICRWISGGHATRMQRSAVKFSGPLSFLGCRGSGSQREDSAGYLVFYLRCDVRMLANTFTWQGESHYHLDILPRLHST